MNVKLVSLGLVIGLWISSVQAATSDLKTLRERFQTWQQTYQTVSVEEQKDQLEALTRYALFPYAQYQFLQNNLAVITPQDVNRFVHENRDFPYTTQLTQQYLTYLTEQNNWKAIMDVNADSSIASQCQTLFAQYQIGQKTKALASVRDIWLSSQDLPAVCDPLFEVWEKSGNKSANTILLRIELMLQNHNIKLARYLTDSLPDNYKTLKKNLYALYDEPRKLADFAANMSPSAFSQKVTVLSFSRLANIDADLAKSLIPTLIKQQKLAPTYQAQFLRSVASNYFGHSVDEEQIKWRDRFIKQDRSSFLVEKRIRLALKTNNHAELADWLNVLPAADKQKEEWLYWRAVVLADNQQDQAAKSILEKLSTERGFYAMFSAQKLDKVYSFDFNYDVIADKTAQEASALIKQKYQYDVVMQRIKELQYWQMLSEANREWRNYLYRDVNQKNYAEIARYAYEQGWGAHSIQATIAGKLWDNWLERLPIVHRNSFKKALDDKMIPLDYALAIARQESALEATVISPSGARGLMQIMPATAKETAKKISDFEYDSSEQLYIPEVNIQLGSRYLDEMYQQFDQNRVLASAAYNAGPNRLKKWLAETGNQLDVIAFIESIPFTETRNYVKSVLVYDYIYRLILDDKADSILYPNEVDKLY